MIARNGWLSMRRFRNTIGQWRVEIAKGALMGWKPVAVRYGTLILRNFWNSKNRGRANKAFFVDVQKNSFKSVRMNSKPHVALHSWSPSSLRYAVAS
jgi:hypothetical protein